MPTTRYVRKTGNDSTGDGTTGNPWLTINKGLTSMSAGDTLRIGAGTYSETSGSGYLNAVLAGSSGAHFTIQSESGSNDVIIVGASSANYNTIFSGSYVDFANVTFSMRVTGNIAAFLFDAANVNHITFTGCAFVGIRGSTNRCVRGTPSGSNVYDTITFTNCALTTSGSGTTGGIYLYRSATDTISNITVDGCTINTDNYPLEYAGVTSSAITNSTLISSGTYGANFDASTYATSVTITGTYFQGSTANYRTAGSPTVTYTQPALYCATTGSDTTGVGSQALPFATLAKAYAVVVAGNTIYLADGTYAEDNGSGRLTLSRTFASPITIQPTLGASGAVKVYGASHALYNILITSASNVTFKWIEFDYRVATQRYCVFLDNTDLPGIVFNACVFKIKKNSNSSTINYGIYGSPASGKTHSVTLTSNSFITDSSTSGNPSVAQALNLFQTTTGTVNLTSSGNTITVDGIGAALVGVVATMSGDTVTAGSTGILLDGSTYAIASPSLTNLAVSGTTALSVKGTSSLVVSGGTYAGSSGRGIDLDGSTTNVTSPSISHATVTSASDKAFLAVGTASLTLDTVSLNGATYGGSLDGSTNACSGTHTLTNLTATGGTGPGFNASSTDATKAVGTVVVSGGTYTSTSQIAFRFGVDGNVGGAITGSLSNVTAVSGTAHGLIIGAGADTVAATGLTVRGGDFGLVLKECSNVTVTNSNLRGGVGDGSLNNAAVLFKAAVNCDVNHCRLTRVGGSRCTVTWEENNVGGNISQNCSVTYCYLLSYNGQGTYELADASKATGAVADHNQIENHGGADYGALLGVRRPSLSALWSGWTDYGSATNSRGDKVFASSRRRR